MCTYFKTETEDQSLRKKIWGYGVSFWKNGSFVYVELKETLEASTSSYSATSEFLRYIYYLLLAKNDQNIRWRCLVHEFSFTYIFFKFDFMRLWLLIPIMKRCAELSYRIVSRRTIVMYRASVTIFILFQLQGWIISRVRTKFLFNNFHAKRVIMEIAMMKILNNCISGRLNNNYFPLNESSSLY